MRTCEYPSCDCPVSFPEGHLVSLETECPRSVAEEIGMKFFTIRYGDYRQEKIINEHDTEDGMLLDVEAICQETAGTPDQSCVVVYGTKLELEPRKSPRWQVKRAKLPHETGPGGRY